MGVISQLRRMLGRGDAPSGGDVDVRSAYAAALRGDVTLVDVREDAEVAEGLAAGARHIALSRLPGALDELPVGPVAITCRSGARSQKAVAMAVAHGRPDVQNVTGGFIAWQAAGLPTDPHPHPKGTA